MGLSPKDIKERLKRMRQKTNDDVKNREKGGDKRKGVIDLSSLDNKEITFFKPNEQGKEITKGVYACKVDILPYIVATGKHPNNVSEGELDYAIEWWQHRSIGVNDDSVICLKKTFGKPCPICEDMEKKIAEGEDQSEINALKPSWKVMYNVIDKNSGKSNIQLFIQSRQLFHKEMLKEMNVQEAVGGEMIYPADIENGYTVLFRANDDTFKGNKFFNFSNFAFIKRDKYDYSVIEDTIPLDSILRILSYEEIACMYYQLDEDDIQEEKEDAHNNVEVEDNDEEKLENMTEEEQQRPKTIRKKIEEEEEEEEEVIEEEESDDLTGISDRKELLKIKQKEELDTKIYTKDSIEKIKEKIREARKLKEPPFDTEEEEEVIEEKPKPQRVRRNSKPKETSSSSTKCPFNHEFGKDCDYFDECTECVSEYADTYKKCEKEFNSQKGKK